MKWKGGGNQHKMEILWYCKERWSTTDVHMKRKKGEKITCITEKGFYVTERNVSSKLHRLIKLIEIKHSKVIIILRWEIIMMRMNNRWEEKFLKSFQDFILLICKNTPVMSRTAFIFVSLFAFYSLILKIGIALGLHRMICAYLV